MIPEIDIWRVANLMLKRYGDEADIESAIRPEDPTEEGDKADEARCPHPDAPTVGSVALKDQNKLPGGVPKNTPFQRSSEAERAEFETGITAPKFRAENARFGADFNSNARFFTTV